MTRVLVVDDQPGNLYMLRALLEGHGYAVTDARHGVEALEKARQHPPQLVISDLLMPVLDGYTFLRHWRADLDLKTIPVIVYTATYTTPRDERLAMAFGADLFLVKPADPEVIVAHVRHLLEQRIRGELPSMGVRPVEQHAFLTEYNEVLIRKLEEKALEAERINNELRDSEERFRATFEQTAVGMAHVGLDGRFLFVNAQLCTLTGYNRDDLLQHTLLDLTLPDDRTEGSAQQRAMLEGRQRDYTSAKRYLRQDGSVFWANVVTTMIRDRVGAPEYFVAVIVDITDRKRSEDALRLRDRAIQEVSQGLLIADAHQPDRPIIYVSAGFERMTGYSSAEVLGRNCRFLQGADTDPDSVGILRDAVANGRACAVEILNYRKDGASFWNALTVNPVYGDAGEVTHFVGVQHDVTERRKLEEQLRQSQKMEAVGRLAGGVAHDFNNLLTIICGYSELMLDTPGISEADRAVVKEISDAGDRAAALTRQLLAFSRKSLLQPDVIDVNVVVTEVSRLLRRLLGADIVLTTMLEPDLGTVKVDAGQLEQVLMNLAVNARDAMPNGGCLTIETTTVGLSDEHPAAHVDVSPGPQVMLAVTDTGCGMTRELVARIFEPFFTTKDKDKGTGLGLSMVFGIVQQSGGTIHVDSEPQRGTTFRIYFPLAATSISGQMDVSPPGPLGGSETILLVEDEAGVRALALRSLLMHGYRVLTATDGHDALRVAEAHDGAIDIVLTDVVMPHASGPVLVRNLQVRYPRLRVLFMSGYTDDSVVRHGLLDAGGWFIQKPYTPSGLAQKVRAVLDHQAAGA